MHRLKRHELPPVVPARTDRLLAILHQAAEHRIDPGDIPGLLDWIVEETTLSPAAPRGCAWDWVVDRDALNAPARRG